MLKSAHRRPRSRAWTDQNPVVALADELELTIPENSPFNARPRVFHPGGASRRGRYLTLVLRLVLFSGGAVGCGVADARFSAAASGLQGHESFLMPLLAGLAACCLAMYGLFHDAPRFALLVWRLMRGWRAAVAIMVALAAFSLCVYLLPGMTFVERVQGLCAATLFVTFARFVLVPQGPGGMVRRHRRRGLGIALTGVLWLLGGWLLISLVLLVLPPPADAGGVRSVVTWVLGLFLVFVGYVAAAARRKQRLYARLVSAIDSLLSALEAPDGQIDDHAAVVLRCKELDRLLSSTVDLGSRSFGVCFESDALCLVVRTALAKLYGDAVLCRLGGVSGPATLVERRVREWSVPDCRRYLALYLHALRSQLAAGEDVLAAS
jgi:hypothetical protein